MTLVAAIYPRGGSPFFIADTLISRPGSGQGLMQGPSGIVRLRTDAEFRPDRLEQKSCIISRNTLVAYAGASFIGAILARRIAEGLGDDTPSRAKLSEITANYLDELEIHNTSAIVAYIQDGQYGCLTLGQEFARQEFPDGTVCLAAGTGAAAFFRDFRSATTKNSNFAPGDLDAYHRLIMQVCGMMGNYFAWEAINAEFESHFGGITELVRATPEGFEKFPGATIITEIVALNNADLTIRGGNYLNYRYLNDILVYRRFGQIRGDEASAAFGSDYLVSTVKPLVRKPTRAELDEATAEILASSFQDSPYFVFSWIEEGNPDLVRVNVCASEKAGFEIGRTQDQFWLFRSHAFLKRLARRFGVKRVFIGDNNGPPAYPVSVRKRVCGVAIRVFRLKRPRPFEI